MLEVGNLTWWDRKEQGSFANVGEGCGNADIKVGCLGDFIENGSERCLIEVLDSLCVGATPLYDGREVVEKHCGVYCGRGHDC